MFDNGDANYCFTTDEPLPDNSATMEVFLDMVNDTDDTIEWDYDGSQAFGKMRNGRTIQIDAGGDGDFTHHLVSVKIIKWKWGKFLTFFVVLFGNVKKMCYLCGVK